MAGVGKVLRWSHDELAFRFIKDPDIAEIRFNHFLGDNFPKFLEDTFKHLRDKHTKTLVIDLRGNGGGADEYGALLVSYLTDKPFRYFDHINLNTLSPSPSVSDALDLHADFLTKLRNATTPNPVGGYLLTPKMNSGLNLQQPSNYPFTGNVFVLIDGGSFSCSADVCAILHHLKRATFIGEETGGGYYGNNSGAMPTLTLPHSKISIRFPLYAYWNAVSQPDLSRRGTMADFQAPIKTGDVIRGVDAGLETAVKLAKNP
jgi:C-terminal processing protease CtpA/Prc